MSERTFDVVLWGATGFTGRLVARYLLSCTESLRWAIAGRDRSKLSAVRDDLATVREAARELPLLVADRADPASLAAMVRQTRVICATVGPFSRLGHEIVAACVEHGTDYCDITGEVPFVRRMIDAHHDEARRRGLRIVHACGFDSIPSDLGVLMLHDHAHRAGARLAEVKYFLTKAKGGLSGGTFASMLDLVEAATADRSLRRLMGNPYALNPVGQADGPDGSDQTGVAFDRDIGRFTAPFVMAGVNTRIVRRTNAILDYPYGRDFRYSEAMSFSGGPGGLLAAGSVTAMLGGFAAAALFPPARRALQSFVLPAPGTGPSKQRRDSGFFRVELHAKTIDEAGQRGRLVGRIAGTSDPGYGETAKMVGEAALCLALDRDRLGNAAGVLTPASAMGQPLIERLRRAGMMFEVESGEGGT